MHGLQKCLACLGNEKKNPVLRAQPTRFFSDFGDFFFNLPKFCKIGRFMTKILKFYRKNVENNQNIFSQEIFAQNVFQVIFAPEIFFFKS